MIGYELSDRDKAVLACFAKATETLGLDGAEALPAVERGVLAAAELARAHTLLQVFTALKIGGRTAAEAAFKAGAIDVPGTLEEVQEKLRQIYRSSHE